MSVLREPDVADGSMTFRCTVCGESLKLMVAHAREPRLVVEAAGLFAKEHFGCGHLAEPTGRGRHSWPAPRWSLIPRNAPWPKPAPPATTTRMPIPPYNPDYESDLYGPRPPRRSWRDALGLGVRRPPW